MVARLIYGFRISVAFGLILTILSSIIGMAAGAVQGYFGGWTDLLFQRFIDIWTSMPTLYLLIILAAFITPTFWLLLFILVLFSWTGLVGRGARRIPPGTEFRICRAAAKALGLSDAKIMFKHLLPNAMVSTITFMPFILSGSVTTLTALDFLGFGLPPGSASLGELSPRARTTCRRHGWASPASSSSRSCCRCWSSSARRCAMRSIRERPLHERQACSR